VTREEVKVTWDSKTTETVIDAHEAMTPLRVGLAKDILPSNVISSSKGTDCLTLEYASLPEHSFKTITNTQAHDFLLKTVREHLTVATKARILVQRAIVRSIPFWRVTAAHGKDSFSFWVSGEDQKVWETEYPQSCVIL